MRSAYLETLYDLAQLDKRVYAIISDNGAIVYDKYRKDLPKQYINAGIAEANMVGMAAGLARRGKIPFAYTIGAFLAYRAYEFILNDVCLQKQNVKLVGIGAGAAYSLLGASHHSIFDIAALRPLPNLTIFSPASPREVKNVVKAAYKQQGPVYIRLGTNREPEIYNEDYDFISGRGVKLREGTDAVLIGTGSIMYDVLQVANILQQENIHVGVINIHTLKPFDEEMILAAAEKTDHIISVEEHSMLGGLGDMIARVLAEHGSRARLHCLGISDFVQGYGKHEDVKAANGLGQERILLMVKKALGLFADGVM